MERCGVESVYCEANASESFPAFAPPNFNRKQIIKQPSPAVHQTVSGVMIAISSCI